MTIDSKFGIGFDAGSRWRSALNVAYVAIVSRDFGCVESAFERQLGLVRATVEFKGSPVAAYQVGETKIIVLPPDSPALPGPAKTNVHHLAIESADPMADAKASGLWHRPTETHASFDGGTRVFAPSTATSGVMLCCTTPLKVCDPVTAITQRIDHLGIVTDSRSAAQEEFCGGGLPLESFQTDSRPNYRSRPSRPANTASSTTAGRHGRKPASTACSRRSGISSWNFSKRSI